MIPQPGTTKEFFQWTIEGPWTSVQNEQYKAVVENDRLYIAFQQTKGALDWLSNCKALPIGSSERRPVKAYPEMSKRWYSHQGFTEAWRLLQPEIEYIRKDYYNTMITLHKTAQFSLSGYSRGSGINILASEYFEYEDILKITKIESNNFAPPRVIWIPFSWNVAPRLSWINLIIDEGDLVTHEPPALFGYVHIGKKIIVSKRDQFFLTTEEHREKNYLACLPSEKEVVKNAKD